MIIIVGCGYLGSYLAREVLKNTNESLIVTSRMMENRPLLQSAKWVCCDVTDIESIRRINDLCRGEELTVFYLAAEHNIDYVYENPKKAQQTNVQGLKNFIENIPNIKKLFFASTDCVYGEGNELLYSFSENSLLNPINEYGRQKIEAEKVVLANGYTVLRFPFMLGPSLGNKPHFYDKIYSSLLSGDTIELIDGMKRSTISFSQAAKFMVSLFFLENIPQIINVCADDVLSKYEIGLRLAEKTGAATDNLKKISEDEGKRFFKEKRASYVAMDNSVLKSLLNIKKIQWEEEKC